MRSTRRSWRRWSRSSLLRDFRIPPPGNTHKKHDKKGEHALGLLAGETILFSFSFSIVLSLSAISWQLVEGGRCCDYCVMRVPARLRSACRACWCQRAPSGALFLCFPFCFFIFLAVVGGSFVVSFPPVFLPLLFCFGPPQSPIPSIFLDPSLFQRQKDSKREFFLFVVFLISYVFLRLSTRQSKTEVTSTRLAD
jgi:hypothetical protein